MGNMAQEKQKEKNDCQIVFCYSQVLQIRVNQIPVKMADSVPQWTINPYVSVQNNMRENSVKNPLVSDLSQSLNWTFLNARLDNKAAL